MEVNIWKLIKQVSTYIHRAYILDKLPNGYMKAESFNNGMTERNNKRISVLTFSITRVFVK